MKAELLRNIEDLQECSRRVGVEVAKMELDEDVSNDCYEYCDQCVKDIGTLIRVLKHKVQSENKNGK